MDALRLITAGTPTRNYDEIERLLSCPICLEVFSKPVVILPCQHNLCRECANDMYENRGTPMGSGGRFKCPSCRHEVILDRHGVYGLQRNLLVENIIDMYQSEGRRSRKNEQQGVMCDEHEDERVNIYCTTCRKPTCSLCKVFGQHQDCDVAPMEKIYEEQKSEISDAIALLASGNDKLQSIILQTEELARRTEMNGQRVQKNVNDAFQQLHTILEERKLHMLNRVEADMQERKQVLETMLENYKSQLASGSRLMSASLALLEERKMAQFLKLSSELTVKVLEVVSASEVRKPPFNIDRMGEFHINFHFQKEILTKLDFTPLNQDDGESLLDCDRAAMPSFSSTIAGCEVIVEEEIDDVKNDGRETASSLATSEVNKSTLVREDASEKGDESVLLVSSDNSIISDENDCPYCRIFEKKKCHSTKPQPEAKQGRWYDMYVRELPAPITVTGFSAPMESSVHMKVVIPGLNKDVADDVEDLKKENTAAAESNVSEETDDLDLEIERLLAPRRRRFTPRFRYSPEISPPPSPSSLFVSRDFEGEESPSLSASPIFLPRSRKVRDSSPSAPVLHKRSSRSNYFRSSSPSSASQHFQPRNESPSNKFGKREQTQTSKSPARGSSSPTGSDTRRQERESGSPSMNQAGRRPRLYCTHKRRTWSHLLNKR